jgi:hypothetical protein
LHLLKFYFSFKLLIYFIFQKLNVILLSFFIQYLNFILSKYFGEFDASLSILELTQLICFTNKIFWVFIFKERLSLVHIIIFNNIFFVIWKWKNSFSSWIRSRMSIIFVFIWNISLNSGKTGVWLRVVFHWINHICWW